MTLEIATALNVDVTYGWLVTQVASGGPADKAGLKGGTSQIQVVGGQITAGGDIITALGWTRIRNSDDLLSYLEQDTTPNQTIDVTILRNGETMTLQVKLGALPTA